MPTKVVAFNTCVFSCPCGYTYSQQTNNERMYDRIKRLHKKKGCNMYDDNSRADYESVVKKCHNKEGSKELMNFCKGEARKSSVEWALLQTKILQ